MALTRRLFTAGLATAALSARAQADASDDRALFWSAEPSGGQRGVLFGYERVAAARTPDIVRDGERFADGQQRLVAAMPNARFPQVGMARKETTPLLGRLPPRAADRVRGLLQQDVRWRSLLDDVSGLELVAFLMFDGQTPSPPTVGGTIAESAQAKGKPIVYLLSQADLLALLGKPDLAALDKRIGEATVTWLLDLHDKVGPIGKHYETLYAERRSADIQRLNEEMRRRGVPSFNEMAGLKADEVEAALGARTVETLTGPTGGSAFVMLPLGTLGGKDGVLARLRNGGVKVAPLA